MKRPALLLVVLAVALLGTPAGRRRLVHVLTRLTGTWVGAPEQ